MRADREGGKWGREGGRGGGGGHLSRTRMGATGAGPLHGLSTNLIPQIQARQGLSTAAMRGSPAHGPCQVGMAVPIALPPQSLRQEAAVVRADPLLGSIHILHALRNARHVDRGCTRHRQLLNGSAVDYLPSSVTCTPMTLRPSKSAHTHSICIHLYSCDASISRFPSRWSSAAAGYRQPAKTDASDLLSSNGRFECKCYCRSSIACAVAALIPIKPAANINRWHSCLTCLSTCAQIQKACFGDNFVVCDMVCSRPAESVGSSCCMQPAMFLSCLAAISTGTMMNGFERCSSCHHLAELIPELHCKIWWEKGSCLLLWKTTKDMQLAKSSE